jgi:uncharacterized protein
MRLLFVTDLHGCSWKYEKLVKAAQQHCVDIVVNGGDMLPKNGDLLKQDQFITGYLQKHFQQFEQAKIHYLCCLGNDDLKIFDPLFETISQQYQYIQNLAQKKASIQDMEFIGMNWVVDYPFRLKDRCRKDTADYVFQRQFGTGLLSTGSGLKEIENWQEYANTLPTIEDELMNLPKFDDRRHGVYVIHMPPANLELDVCGNGMKVGSAAVTQFLQESQPCYSLHGHIHESPEAGGVWKASLGDTTCIQPGQMKKLTYVIIDFSTGVIERVAD